MCQGSARSQTVHLAGIRKEESSDPRCGENEGRGRGRGVPSRGEVPGVCSDERGEEGVGQKWEDRKAPQVRRFPGEMLPG